MSTETFVSHEIESNNTLLDFLVKWDENYKIALNAIKMFNSEWVKSWTDEQKKLFIKILYHQRGHFSDVLWYMGNYAPNFEFKEMIIDNIRDEFGKYGLSHEALYINFAKGMGVDLSYELLEEEMYLPFIRQYNQGHLRWLRENDWDHRFAAFAALERLDNLDYSSLRDIAVAMGAQKKDLVFFNVHIYVTHYEDLAKEKFNELWHLNPRLVTETFNFIARYQTKMWGKISDEVFNYQEHCQN